MSTVFVVIVLVYGVKALQRALTFHVHAPGRVGDFQYPYCHSPFGCLMS